MTPGQQWFKWTVYALLFFDFILYFIQDAQSARYTLDGQSTLLEYTSAYVTSIDLVAWFALILLFELETYVLIGRKWSGASKWAVRGVRLVCCVAIFHTSFSYDIALRDFQNPRALPGAADVCAFTDGNWSFLRNRDFLEIDRGNCSVIGRGPEFFAISDDAVITDRAGLHEGLILAWTDLVESVLWLLVVLLTELAVRLKARPGGNPTALARIERSKVALYLLIVAIAFYWGSKQQYLYLWDELIWVLGFLVIDRNINNRWSWQRQRHNRSLSASPPAA